MESGQRDVWQEVASSADGTKLIAMAGLGSVYLSHDSGATWVAANFPTQAHGLASSADGSKLVAGTYISSDSGATWTSNYVPGEIIACSADGNKLVAQRGGEIWTAQTTPMPALSIGPSGTNILLSWVVPSMDFVPQENSDLTTTNWTVMNTPTLNLTNLQYQLMVSPSAGNPGRFYRLKH
jgi:hypothetical protein